MPDHCPPTELLQRTAMGDERAFARLHVATVSKMRKVARQTLSNSCELDDVLQEAYLKIWSKARQYNPERSSPISWMSAVVRNCAIDFVRSSRVRDAAMERWMVEVPLFAVNAPGLDHVYAQVGPAMQVLSADRQMMIFRAYLRGESRNTLAAEFGAPPSTIKTWLRRSLLAVREAIDWEQPA